ncbi:hypothetical protein F7725_010898 [Dissostichus mawsoni]|uniref:Uncharacterized protein n=1 Tax=Dissostichus mawsoni TaxID=36200 RepID=A0A7J5ZAK9_DISMA|nr:hypothetical protein F7725_010898 [Dissostichus mawsoni]
MKIVRIRRRGNAVAGVRAAGILPQRIVGNERGCWSCDRGNAVPHAVVLPPAVVLSAVPPAVVLPAAVVLPPAVVLPLAVTRTARISTSRSFLRSASFSLRLRETSSCSTASPLSTSSQISATAVFARTSMMEASCACRDAAGDMFYGSRSDETEGRTAAFWGWKEKEKDPSDSPASRESTKYTGKFFFAGFGGSEEDFLSASSPPGQTPLLLLQQQLCVPGHSPVAVRPQLSVRSPLSPQLSVRFPLSPRTTMDSMRISFFFRSWFSLCLRWISVCRAWYPSATSSQISCR